MYSPSPCRSDGTFDLIVRMYKNGNVSRQLGSMRLGGSVFMRPFPPSLPADRRNPGRHVGLVAYGVGITEIYWTAMNELSDPGVQDVVLVYATRTMEEQKVYGPELEELQRQEPRRFRLEKVLSRQRVQGARHGRVNAQLLSEVFPWSRTSGSRAEARFAVAGNKEMINTTFGWLADIGYPESCKLIRDLSVSSLLSRRFRAFWGA
ncbi:CBR1 [Symbiodinium sp. CCMP2592]|nr:CBR1 [Symbiodinium sp. CCMP2592]